MDVSFNAAVDLIVRHRKANPTLPLATDFESVAWELEQRTLARIGEQSQFSVNLSPVMAITHEPVSRSCRSCG